MDAEDGIGLGGTLARATTVGTAGVLCGEKTETSCRVSVNPNSAILGWISPLWRSVMRSRIETLPANFPKKDA